MKKINLNKEHRLKQINELALVLQDTKLKSLREIRKIAESIELLSDEKILIGLNKSIDDFKHGRYTVVTNDTEADLCKSKLNNGGKNGRKTTPM